MIFISREHKLKILNSFVALLILFLQVVPDQESKIFGDHKLPEWNIERNIALASVNGNQPSQTSLRHINEINLSPAHSFYDRYDILSIPELTDSTKIYGGGFSYSHRYRSFLSVIFSTST